jgi:hypothetical protein
MSEEIRKNDEILELELHRNTPFEFDATADSRSRVTVVTTTVTKPQGSWQIVQAAQRITPFMPKWMPSGQVR